MNKHLDCLDRYYNTPDYQHDLSRSAFSQEAYNQLIEKIRLDQELESKGLGWSGKPLQECPHHFTIKWEDLKANGESK